MPKQQTILRNKDKIFILSSQEVIKYYSNPLISRLQMDDSCATGNEYSYSGNTWWWLRTKGKFDDFFAGVLPNGNIDYIGNNYTIPNAIRPAFWIDMDYFK